MDMSNASCTEPLQKSRTHLLSGPGGSSDTIFSFRPRPSKLSTRAPSRLDFDFSVETCSGFSRQGGSNEHDPHCDRRIAVRTRGGGEIVAYADSIDANLIVVGSRDHRAIANALLGCVLRRVLHEA